MLLSSMTAIAAVDSRMHGWSQTRHAGAKKRFTRERLRAREAEEELREGRNVADARSLQGVIIPMLGNERGEQQVSAAAG